VLVTARTPVDGLYKEIARQIESDTSVSSPGPTLDKIGDCDAPAIIAAAVYAGHRYARELGTDLEQIDVVRQDRPFHSD
jgi:dimethylamine/trimethylamine dehydrogenase